MVETKEFDTLLFSSQMKHPTQQGAFFLCLFFKNGVSITGVNRSFEKEIDTVLKEKRAKSTPWPEYNASGHLIYTFKGFPYFTIREDDMISVDVSDVRDPLESYISDTKKKYDTLHSKW